MISLHIEDTKDFMNKLLLTPVFDHFCLVSASISTFQNVEIDGKRNKDFFSSEENESAPPYNTWETVKPFCLSLIKGKRTPLFFRITLTLSPDNIKRVLEANHYDLDPSMISGLLMNFKYDGKQITCTTGTSIKVFTMDKSLEFQWDNMAELFLKKNHIISTRI